jgi:hypothetical protein
MYIRYLHKIFTLSVFDTVQACTYIQYIQGLFQSGLSTADYALVTSSLHYLTVVELAYWAQN